METEKRYGLDANGKQWCTCSLCDNAEEAGCPNEGVILTAAADNYTNEDLWLCPHCAGSVAAMNKVKTGRALTAENLAELNKAEKVDKEKA